MVMAADYAGVIQAFAAKQVEVAYMSPGRLRRRLAGEQRRCRAAVDGAGKRDGSTSYHSVMYVRADIPASAAWNR